MWSLHQLCVLVVLEAGLAHHALHGAEKLGECVLQAPDVRFDLVLQLRHEQCCGHELCRSGNLAGVSEYRAHMRQSGDVALSGARAAGRTNNTHLLARRKKRIG